MEGVLLLSNSSNCLRDLDFRVWSLERENLSLHAGILENDLRDTNFNSSKPYCEKSIAKKLLSSVFTLPESKLSLQSFEGTPRQADSLLHEYVCKSKREQVPKIMAKQAERVNLPPQPMPMP